MQPLYAELALKKDFGRSTVLQMKEHKN